MSFPKSPISCSCRSLSSRRLPAQQTGFWFLPNLRAPVKAHWLDEEIFVGKLVLTPMFHRALPNHNIINRDRGIYHMVLPLERELHNQLIEIRKRLKSYFESHL